MNTTIDLDNLGLIDTCPQCGSDDLGHCGHTEERTHLDITDVVECESCDWSITRPLPNS
jgi:predicted RNA-binding Zn-ribbon protein involved in translation (DUF1610 family)